MASWDDQRERSAWTAALFDAVRAQQPALEKGHAEGFLRGYAELCQAKRTVFWVELVIALAKAESAWDPRAGLNDPECGVGLLRLRPLKGPLDIDWDNAALEDPLINLRYGVRILARMIAADGMITGGSARSWRGAARYWESIRSPDETERIKMCVRDNLHMPAF